MRRRRDPERVSALVVVIAILVGHAAFVSGWIIDDAYISFRYSHHLAHGHGLAWNPGDRVEGYTNFAWVLLAAAGIRAGIAPTILMPALGLASAVALALLVAREGRRVAEEAGRPHALAGVGGALVVALSTDVAFYAVSGLETALFALLVTAAAAALVRGRGATFGALTAAAFLTRPEAGLLGVVGVAGLVVAAARGDRDARRAAARATAAMAAIVGPYLAWKLAYFGAVLPNTLAAKPPDHAGGVGYVARYVPALAGVIACAAHGAARGGRAPRALVGLWALFAAAVVLEGGDWMPAHRLLVPWLGLLAIAADRSLVEASSPPSRDDRRRGPWLARAALGVAFAGYVGASAVSSAAVRERGAVLAGADAGRTAFARELVAAGVRSIGTFDVGLLGYAAPELRVLDLGGLTDRAIARAPGWYFDKQPPVEYLAAHAPEAFVLTSADAPRIDHGAGRLAIPPHYAVEAYVQGLPWFRERYEYVGTRKVFDNYYLHWFAGPGAPRPTRDAPPIW